LSNNPNDVQRRSLTAFLARLKILLGDEGLLQPCRIREIISAFRQLAICDSRLFYFCVTAIPSESEVVLQGAVSLKEHKTGLLDILRVGGIGNIRENIRVLPEPELLGNHLALVNAPVAGLFKKPSLQSEQLSQLLPGDAVILLKQEQEYFLVQGPDGYIGWMASGNLRLCSEESLREWLSMPKAILTAAIRVGRVNLPPGAELPLLQGGTILLPDQSHQVLAPGSYRTAGDSLGALRKAVVSSAEQFLGVPYFWGGKSPAGMDCSGLVQVAYQMAGIALPRDADQQYLSGRTVAGRHFRGSLETADLLFFAGVLGNLTHVAISLGGDRFIHAAAEGVTVGSLNPKDAGYDERRASSFVLAKRIIN